ncbi:MAG: ankyrin repeat domain-containing protein [Chlamydiia bacterium]|nr:ankyrin repeat domain-containing protein [Chlamydiia bacterium]
MVTPANAHLPQYLACTSCSQLMRAIDAHDTERALSLLEDAVADTQHLTERDHFGWTALETACLKGESRVACRIVELVPSSTLVQGKHGAHNPLSIACYKGLKDVVEAIVQRVPAENLADPDGRGDTPLWLATKHHHPEILECLQRAMRPCDYRRELDRCLPWILDSIDNYKQTWMKNSTTERILAQLEACAAVLCPLTKSACE